MKGLLLWLLLSIPLLSAAQSPGVRLLSKDSVPGVTDGGWRFADGDKPEYALPSFDDSGLPLVSSQTIAPKAKKGGEKPHTLFKGIGWLRLGFRCDSTMSDKALALGIVHNGASEIYLDGKKIDGYGVIGNESNSEYENPHFAPTSFVIRDTAAHLLAVRYANRHYNSRNPIYEGEKPGFFLSLNTADNAYSNRYITMLAITATCNMLFGIFFAITLLHLLFFLYNRKDKSNLLFSLFCLALALLFFIPFLNRTVGNPTVILSIDRYCFLLAVLACFALTGFLGLLFERGRRTLYVFSVLYLLIVLGFFLFPGLNEILALTLITTTAINAIVRIIAALARRVPGARIIGGGLGLLIILLIVIIAIALVAGNISVNIGGNIGLALIIVIGIAILSIPVSFSAFLARNFSVLSKSLTQQLVQVETLSAEKQALLQSRQQELEAEVAAATAEVRQQHDALKIEKKKTDDLLLNILPEEVAEELKDTGISAARLYEHVSVLFTDFVDFTQHSEKLSPAALVAEIHECFKGFDGIIEQYGLEKIKTVGDAYIAVAGLPVGNEHHAQQVIAAAIAVRDFMVQRKAAKPDSFDIRLGVHSGPVVAGIVGVKKFAYDIWGDTVNTAARMEQSSEAGKINISAATYLLAKEAFSFTYRGEIDAKHKGKMGMYFAEDKA